MNKFKYALIVAALQGVATMTAVAAEDIETRQGWNVQSFLGSYLLFDSNLYLQPSDEVDAIAFVLDPGLDFTYSDGRSLGYLRYRGQLAEYDTTSEDDYLDNEIKAGFDVSTDSRNRFKAEASYLDAHVPFGVDRTEGTSRENRDLDKYALQGIKGEYMFGAEEAVLNFGIYGGYQDLAFTSNQDETFFLDRNILNGGLRGIFNYSKRTKFLLEYDNREIEFEEASPGFSKRDATEQRILAGVRWYATGKTFGTLKVGHVSRDHDASDRDDFSGFDWDVDLGWSPTQRDTLIFETQQTTRESFFEQADFIKTQSAGITWKHQWSQRFDTEIGVAGFTAEFDGSPREDDLMRLEILGTYVVNRHLNWEFGYEFKERDSNDDLLDYDRNIIHAGIRLRY